MRVAAAAASRSRRPQPLQQYRTRCSSTPHHLVITYTLKLTIVRAPLLLLSCRAMSLDAGVGYGGNKIVCDMDEHGEMKSDAMSQAAKAIEQFTEEKAISRDIKGYMDSKYGPTALCGGQRFPGVRYAREQALPFLLHRQDRHLPVQGWISDMLLRVGADEGREPSAERTGRSLRGARGNIPEVPFIDIQGTFDSFACGRFVHCSNFGWVNFFFCAGAGVRHMVRHAALPRWPV